VPSPLHTAHTPPPHRAATNRPPGQPPPPPPPSSLFSFSSSASAPSATRPGRRHRKTRRALTRATRTPEQASALPTQHTRRGRHKRRRPPAVASALSKNLNLGHDTARGVVQDTESANGSDDRRAEAVNSAYNDQDTPETPALVVLARGAPPHLRGDVWRLRRL